MAARGRAYISPSSLVVCFVILCPLPLEIVHPIGYFVFYPADPVRTELDALWKLSRLLKPGNVLRCVRYEFPQVFLRQNPFQSLCVHGAIPVCCRSLRLRMTE